jgi:hypothetical protein
VAHTKDVERDGDLRRACRRGSLPVSGQKRRRISGRQAMQNEITEGALGRPPAAGIHTIVIFLFIPAAVKDRVAFARHLHVQIDFRFTRLSSHRGFVADQALDAVLRASQRSAPRLGQGLIQWAGQNVS